MKRSVLAARHLLVLAARCLLAQCQEAQLGLGEGGEHLQVCEKALPAAVRVVARCRWAVLEKDMKWRNDDYTAQTT